MQSLIQQSAEAAGENLQVFVACNIAAESSRGGRVLFDIAGAELNQRSYTAGEGRLTQLATSATLDEFATAIRRLDGATTAWYWIDIIIGCPFSLDLNGPDALNRCAAMLKPFERWMRATN